MRAWQRPRLLDFALFAATYLFFVLLNSAAVVPDGAPIIWLPNAVLLAALILFEGRGAGVFGLIAVALLPIAGAAGLTPAERVAVGVINAGEALLAAMILRRRRFNPRELTIRDVSSFAFAAPVIASMLGAMAASGVVAAFHGGGLAFEYFRVRWASDALGLAVLTPALLTVALYRPASPRTPARWGWWDTAASAALAATLLFTGGGSVATGPQGGPILALPLMIALAARTSTGAISVIAAGVAALVVAMLRAGVHPFGLGIERSVVIKAQQFMFVTTVVTQGLAAMLGQIRQKRAEVEQLNAELEDRVKARTAELELALSQVRQLQGLVPICAWCKRVRDDKDFWHSVEQYIEARTDAQFSHGICPSCFDEQIKDNDLDAELEDEGHAPLPPR